MSELHEKLGTCHPKLSRGQVWCRECGRTQKVNSGGCMQYGWPKCCGYTMTIDSPEEQKALSGYQPIKQGGLEMENDKLPEGKICADCDHYEKTCILWLVGVKRESSVCDWTPSKFKETRQINQQQETR